LQGQVKLSLPQVNRPAEEPWYGPGRWDIPSPPSMQITL
jgi:hypothetical protein